MTPLLEDNPVAKKLHVTTTINGEPVEFLCEARQSLLEVLRDTLNFTGAKEGCNNGNCGACTVLGRRPAGRQLPGAGRRSRGGPDHDDRRGRSRVPLAPDSAVL